MARIRMMFTLSPELKKSFCLTLTAILMWLGGLGCALCCATMATEVCCAEEISATRTMLSAGESEHACCQISQSNDNSSTGSVISKGASLRGCALLPQHETSLALIPRVAGDEAIALPPGESLTFYNVAIDIPSAVIYASPPGRSDTYLRCCVLLI